ncbi:MAG: ABC transporter ATP-binding protein/permease [Bacteroidales bacterium]|nr:ABC transporter ATP-binding protein/permease [Bacteroidales bacterium]MCM1414574.1 ABC transporter ATP-binding protein/permease [bacterium]MCM1422624.1 ABC transporter ATP-binding protein/permease [bacterium]
MEKKPTLLQKIAYLFDRRQLWQLAGLAVLILIGGVLETLGVSMMLPVVDAVMAPEEFMEKSYVKGIAAALHIESSRQIIIVMLVSLIALFVVKNLYLLFQVYVQNTFVTRNRNRMISRVMREFLNRPYEDYLGADIPTVFRLTDSDIPNAFQLILVLIQMITEIVVAVSICIVLVTIVSPLISIGCGLLFLGITLVITKILKPRLNRIGRKNQEIQSRIAKWRIQSIYGLKDVKVLHREEFFVRNYYESGAVGANVARNYAVMNNAPRLLIETVFMAAMLSFILVFTLRGGDFSSLVSRLGALAVAAVRVMPATNRINTYLSEIAYAQPCLDYLYENLTENMKLDVNGSVTGLIGQKEDEGAPLILTDRIVLDHISYTYPNTDKPIFTDAHMEVKKGQSVGIMGPSGAGKSTIVDILLGLLQVQEGTITCDGRNVFENYPSWLSKIGYIPQSIYLIDESIRDNIAFGIDADRIDDERIWEVLAEAQLKQFVEELPEGLDTTIGDRGVRISGGQRQRLGIARALYHDPEILVFDEATSALDGDTETAVMEAVNSFHGRKTMIIIAHRLNTIEKCDLIYKVENGKITETEIC